MRLYRSDVWTDRPLTAEEAGKINGLLREMLSEHRGHDDTTVHLVILPKIDHDFDGFQPVKIREFYKDQETY